ncbi:MAG TPA: hypothetical protein PKI35_10210 [Bacteroidales bacterium]|nr:hypothetical protein [Bacteroidales bacterium]
MKKTVRLPAFNTENSKKVIPKDLITGCGIRDPEPAANMQAGFQASRRNWPVNLVAAGTYYLINRGRLQGTL